MIWTVFFIILIIKYFQKWKRNCAHCNLFLKFALLSNMQICNIKKIEQQSCNSSKDQVQIPLDFLLEQHFFFFVLPMVLMISNSSISYRGGSSCDPSSSDVVLPDIVRRLLQNCQRKFLIYFSRALRHTWKEERKLGSTIHTAIFLDRAPTTACSHICSSWPLHATWFLE